MNFVYVTMPITVQKCYLSSYEKIQCSFVGNMWRRRTWLCLCLFTRACVLEHILNKNESLATITAFATYTDAERQHHTWPSSTTPGPRSQLQCRYIAACNLLNTVISSAKSRTQLSDLLSNLHFKVLLNFL